MLDSLKEQIAEVLDAVKVNASTTTGQAASLAGDFVDSYVAKAKDVTTDTGDGVKKVAGDFCDMVSSTFGEFMDTIEENPLCLGLLWIPVFLLFLGIYFICTHQPKKKEMETVQEVQEVGEVEEEEEQEEQSTSSEGTDKTGNPVEAYVAKAKGLGITVFFLSLGFFIFYDSE